MLTTIIFSKDRPLQLDLTLTSLFKNFKFTKNVKVIYKANEEYKNAYVQLAHEHKDIDFIDQDMVGFEWSLYYEASKAFNYIMFLTDDNIFYRESKTNELDIGNLFARDIACLSLRLGLNITERPGFVMTQPQFTRIASNHVLFNRMSVPACDYFGYPLSVDGHIFKRDVIKDILADLYLGKKAIKNPNILEQMLQRYYFEIPAMMACEIYSCVVNSPNNRVQESVQNWHGKKHPYHQHNLLKIFNDGVRLDSDKIKFPNITCPHTEVDILSCL